MLPLKERQTERLRDFQVCGVMPTDAPTGAPAILARPPRKGQKGKETALPELFHLDLGQMGTDYNKYPLAGGNL